MLLLLVGGAASCKKSVTPPGATNITIINAVAGTTSLSFSGTLTNAPIVYNGSQRYNPLTGPFLFKAYSRNDVDITIGTVPLFNLALDLPIGGISSLFLTGTLEKRDTLFVWDEPVNFSEKDTSMGIRFVNLSTGGGAISINLQGQPNGSEVGNLNYKNLTAFKVYKANSTVSQYTFEFRNATNNDLLATYTISNINNPGSDNAPNVWRKKNITLVFDGLPGSPDWPQTVFIVRNN